MSITGPLRSSARQRKRLREALDKDRGVKRDVSAEDGDKPSIRERLNDNLNKPREKLELGDERESERDRENENERDLDRGPCSAP